VQSLKNLKISGKLFVLIFVAAFFVTAVAATGFFFLNKPNATLPRLDRNDLRAVKLIDEAQIVIKAAQGIVLEYLLNPDTKRRKDLLENLQALGGQLDNLLAELEKTSLSDDQRRNLELLKQMLTNYRDHRDSVLKLTTENKLQMAIVIYTYQSVPILDGINQQLGYISQEFNSKAQEAYAQSSRDVVTASVMMTGLGVSALLIVIALGVTVARMVARPLKEVAATVSEVAAGNLAAGLVAVDSRDEAGEVATAINAMTENLRALIKQVAGTAEQVAASSEQLNASADQAALTSNQVAESISGVAQGSAAQLKAVEESSAAVEQMSATVELVTANASVVAETSAQAAEAAARGTDQISSAVRQIANIEKTVAESARIVETLGERSKEIGQIVDTISSIAGQTNLLALNAAIESARAGEAGRGFAVVAEEVRKLAEQSQDASKQISELIGAIQADTEQAVAAMHQGTSAVRIGSEVVNKAGDAFQEILAAVGRVSDQAGQMSQAIAEMAGGSEKIVASMKEIDAVSKANVEETQNVSAATEEQSATMEEIAASSQGLATIAQDLQTAIRRFTI